MGKLAEFIRTEGEHLRAEAGQRKKAVEEWRTAIGRLFDHLGQWLKEADGGTGLLRIERMPLANLAEGRLGTYTAECFDVGLGSNSVLISPRARYVIARIRPPGEEIRRADGLVEIKSWEKGIASYSLYRLAGANPETDRWFIRNFALWNADTENDNVDVLDRDRFEAAILQMLR